MEDNQKGKDNEQKQINIKFKYNNLKKPLSQIPNNFFELRDDFISLYENITFKYVEKINNKKLTREMPMLPDDFKKAMDYIKKQENPVIVVEKEDILSGEIDEEENEEEDGIGLDNMEEVEEEEPQKEGWTIVGVKPLTSEEKLKISKKGRKEIELENQLRERYEKLKKDMSSIENKKLEEMTYKNAIVTLYTKITPAEELIKEIDEKNLFKKNEVLLLAKKILILKTNYQNIIKKKEEEHSNLIAYKISQQEQGKKNDEQISEIKKKYEEFQEYYKEVLQNLSEEANKIKEELGREKNNNNLIDELKADNVQMMKQLDQENELNKNLLDMEEKLKPLEEEMQKLQINIKDIKNININYEKEKEELKKNIEQLNNLSNDNSSNDEIIKKLNNEIETLKLNSGNINNNDELRKNYENLLKEKQSLKKEIENNNKKQLMIIQKLNQIYKQTIKAELDKYMQHTNEEIKKIKKNIKNDGK